MTTFKFFTDRTNFDVSDLKSIFLRILTFRPVNTKILTFEYCQNKIPTELWLIKMTCQNHLYFILTFTTCQSDFWFKFLILFQALLSIKATLTKDLIEQIDEALAEEEQILIQHWISPECQEKFRNYLTNGHW